MEDKRRNTSREEEDGSMRRLQTGGEDMVAIRERGLY